jgi:hypothetical protein
MALTPTSIINQVVANPSVAAVGLLAGFILAKALDWRKKRKNNFQI